MPHDWPNDTEDKMYLPSEYTFTELQELIQQKWFGVDLSEIRIQATWWQTEGCGCHPDYSDYTDFIHIERIKKK